MPPFSSSLKEKKLRMIRSDDMNVVAILRMVPSDWIRDGDDDTDDDFLWELMGVIIVLVDDAPEEVSVP